jgi:RHS repeat-associated protein
VAAHEDLTCPKSDAEDRRRRSPQDEHNPDQTAQQDPAMPAPTKRLPDGPDQPSSPFPEKPKRAADLLPAVSLQKGGGAIRGLGEKFAVAAATGTATLSLPLPLTPGRGGFTPALQLAYDSGSGNGPFGFGWSLDAPAITRKTDKGLPQYRDRDESDVFILSGAEDLVPILDGTGGRKTLPRTVFGTAFEISFYRPRIEGLFSRIERWVAVGTGITHWRSLSRDNVTTLYGYDAASRIADPADPTHIFSWQISHSWNDKGNLALFSYIPENGAGIDYAQAHETNRTPATRAAKAYLKTVQYGNLQPYYPDMTAAVEPPLPVDFLFSAVLDYGDHAANPPTPQPDQAWPVRPDPFSIYRPGFEVRSYRRVQRLLSFNNFPDELTAGANTLVRSLDLVYSDQQSPADPRNPIYTFLVSATETGYRAEGGATISRSRPPLEFAYSQPQIEPAVLSLDRDSLGNLPEGVDGSRFRWVDLDGEGLSGILSDAGGGWYYKRNLSANNLVAQPDGSALARARFGPLETVPGLPSHSNLSGGQQLLDLSGDGRFDVVELDDPDPGFFKRTTDGTFDPLQRFWSLPQLDWSNPNLKFIDVTGDGLADILLTEDGIFTYYTSLGEAGFDIALLVRTPWDEEKGPKVVLADGTDTIFVADMSGDGLNDIVRVRNGETCYWPNIGYGRFGAKVTMDLAPRFDNEERFDPQRIHLADIDGTGSADLIYVGEDGIRAWFNLSGNAWSAPTEIAVFPTADKLSSVQVIDLLGTGTACLVWSSPLPSQSAAPLLYVDLMGGQKPHLMVTARNNLGAETRVTYAPSTRYYVADEEAGRPWVTRLPFPVHVVERVEIVDWIGRNRLVTSYAYHHGYYDGYEREFRGFGMVEQWDSEEFRADTAFPDGEFLNWDQQSWTPPTLTRTWFHTGAFEEAPAVTQQYLSEYWVEPALIAKPDDAAAMRPPDTVLPDGLNPFEIQEAYRALKGQALRIEVYARDDSPAAVNPITVTEQNFTILCLQNIGINLHAVFFVHPREAVTFHYERGVGDPRIAHEFTLETDTYGNVTRSVSVAYPRRIGNPPPEPKLSVATQYRLAYDQLRLQISAVEHQYTEAIDDFATWPDSYRVPLVSAINAAELTGISPSSAVTGITNLFSFADFDGDGVNPGIWQSLWSGAHDLNYEQIPASDVDGSGAPAATPTRRLVSQQRIVYRSDDLTALLPVGRLQPLALTGQSYQAALTPGLLAGVFGALVPAAVLAEGGYLTPSGEAGSWIPSGRVYYSPNPGDTPAQELAAAMAAFFQPRRAVDPFNATTRIDYDQYALLPVAVTDPVGNLTGAANDYRVLQPVTAIDANGNQSSVAFDALGLVTATAVMGKTSETLGDLLSGFVIDLDEPTLLAQFANPLADPASLLGNATTRLVYDLYAYQRTAASPSPLPPAIYTLSRETHFADLGKGGAPAVTKYQFRFAYSDGLAREIQGKILAPPGPLTAGGATVTQRWIGSGWTIFNNKGDPVRQYEPFFSATNEFEFAAVTGVSTILLYDAVRRVVAKIFPDQSWEKSVFDAWRLDEWDRNDTVLIADPRTDPDVGNYLARALGSGPFTSWYALRITGTFGATAEDRAAQKDAAQKAAAHAATFSSAHFDPLGRTCLSVNDNGGGVRYPRRTAYDTESKPLAVFDAADRRAEEYCYRAPQGGGFQYLAGIDMAGNVIYRDNADAGARRRFDNVARNPIRRWDARGHAFHLVYDPAQRVTQRYVSTGGSPEILLELTVYGEGMPGQNLCGRVFRHYDMTGYAENTQYDFAGNLAANATQLGLDFHQAADWSPLAGLTTAAQLDAAATAAGLIPSGDGGRDHFSGSVWYDALNRPIQIVPPHSVQAKPDVIRRFYDEAAQLNEVDIWLQHAADPAALLDPATADRQVVSSIDYNAREQRIAIAFGNRTVTTYDYDPETFRLAHLTTTRPSSFPSDQQGVQLLAYYYDPIGNITRVRDDADTQDVIYFQNQRVEPSADYTYDPLYRLIAATGREHLGQTGGALQPPQQVTNDDSLRMGLPQPGDGKAMGAYTESYIYDPLGNLQTVSHQVSSSTWTRRYAYAAPSQIVASERCNRLTATSLPGDPANGPFTATYAYDAHGNMTGMPHLPALTWDVDDRLSSTTRQIVNTGTPEITFYVHDAKRQRVRKATDRGAGGGQAAKRKSERVYLGGIEIYREYAADGTTVLLERETLHVDVGDNPIAYVETRTVGSDSAPMQQVRYQHHNHLGSAVLELGDQSDIISYEEYFPFGSTSYQAVASQTDLPKRYRYTGKERDQENDLSYHGARYYAPWLGRWTSCDPSAPRDGLNRYEYVRDRPTIANDPNGRWLNILIGAVVGAVLGGGIELARQAISGEQINWGRVGASALGGAVGGAIAGATLGLGLVAEGLGAGVGAATGGAVTRAVEGEKQTFGQVARDFAFGVITFGLFKGAGAGIRALRGPAAEAFAAGGEGGSEAVASRLGKVISEGGPTGGGKAAAAAEVSVEGYKGDSPIRARSGGGTPDPSVQNVPHAPVPDSPAVTTYKVAGAAGEHAGSRATDAEIKILNEVQKNLPPAAKGTVSLGASKPLCPSCTTGIFEFQGNNPGVRVDVYAPGRPTPTLPPELAPPPAPGPRVGSGAPAAALGAVQRGSSPPPDERPKDEGVVILRF